MSQPLVRSAFPALLAAVLVLAGCGASTARHGAPAVPAPLLEEAPGQARSEVAVLAGGCFWGVQGVSST